MSDNFRESRHGARIKTHQTFLKYSTERNREVMLTCHRWLLGRYYAVAKVLWMVAMWFLGHSGWLLCRFLLAQVK